jgi:lipopolysaccharide transport system permease protein
MNKIIIEAGRAEKNYWKDLIRYRELFIVLAWRNVSVRYKQTVVGFAWAVLQPLLTMIIMTVVFGRVAGLPSEGNTPYAIMVFAGLLPWQFFSNALSSSSQSIVANANLITKVYFPRLIIPVSTVVVALVDFLVSFIILIGLLAWYRFPVDWRILALILFVVVAFLAALGPGLFITALNVRYRDFGYIVPFIVQFGLYVSPIGFSSTVIRGKIGDMGFMAYSLNPMVGVIDGFRWAILKGEAAVFWPGFAVSMASAVLFLVAGISFFRKTEKSFADII